MKLKELKSSQVVMKSDLVEVRRVAPGLIGRKYKKVSVYHRVYRQEEKP